MIPPFTRVVIAPDKFKGSLTAAEAAAAVARGLRHARPGLEIVEHPVADGGEGTVEAAVRSGFERVDCDITGPLGAPRSAGYALRGTTAVIEMAAAAGLDGLPGAPTPDTARAASTSGVGELVRHALDRGATRIVLGLGGSASTDGGAGAVTALGGRITTEAGTPVGPGGAALADAAYLDLVGLDPRIAETEIVVASDVDNPLTGPAGAATVYGPQKGAGPDDVAVLDAALGRWADVVAAAVGRDLRMRPGAGAAGGMGFAALAVLGGQIVPGIDLLLELTHFTDQLTGTTLVVVGEGSLDEQSLRGKSAVGVARSARRAGATTVAVAGRRSVSDAEAEEAGISAIYALADLQPDPARSMTEAAALLEQIAHKIASDLLPARPARRRAGMDKVVPTAAEAVADIVDGSSLAVGGFGLSGIPMVLIAELHARGATNLEVVSNNCGVDDWGLGILLRDRRIRRMVASYVGENKEFARQFLSGELEVELTPQGTLAEKLRAGGAGIPAFYTVTGAGTPVADGGMPLRYHPDGSVAVASARRESRKFSMGHVTRSYVLEESIVCDFGLVRAWKGDRHGNLVFRRSARNFNPLAAMAGRIAVAEVEELVEPGELDPDAVHLPGIYIQRVLPLTPEQAADKRIEKTTVRPRTTESGAA